MAHVAIGKNGRAAGIGRKVAGDAAGAFGAERKREHAAMLGCRLVNIGENAAAVDDHGIADRIDIANAVHALQRQDDVGAALARRLPPDETGIAGLRNDGRAGLAGKLQDRRHLFHRAGLEQQGRSAVIEAAIFDEMRRDFRSIPYGMFFTDDGGEAIEKVGREGGAAHGVSFA